MSVTNPNEKAPLPESGEGSLRVGRLTKPHGLKGGLKIELYTDSPDVRFRPGASFYLQVPETSEWFNKKITLEALRYYNGQAVGFFDEIPDRTAAESIVRAILWIDGETAQSVTEEDAWYDAELTGLTVIRQGESIGRVKSVQHLPAQDLIVVETNSGEEVMVPFVKAIVTEVNPTAGTLTVDPPSGLFESLENMD